MPDAATHVGQSTAAESTPEDTGTSEPAEPSATDTGGATGTHTGFTEDTSVPTSDTGDTGMGGATTPSIATWTCTDLHVGSHRGTVGAAVADVDDDGDMDALSTMGCGMWFENEGASFGPGSCLVPDALSVMTLGDIDGQNLHDIVYNRDNSSSEEVVWRPGSASLMGPEEVVIPVSRQLLAFRNHGSGFDQERLIHDDIAHCETIALADLDGDGDLDLIGSDLDLLGLGHEVTIWENDGAAFLPGRGVAGSPTPTDLEVADFFSDGRLEILVASSDRTTVCSAQ